MLVVLTRSTWQGSTRLEHAMFSYDRLGHRTGMTRYQDAAAGANPVTSSWHFDSLGQMLELDESGAAPRYNTYSNWGELISTLRNAPGNPSSTTLSVVSRYDAFGRLIHREQQTNGVADAATVNDYQYDQPVVVTPYLNPTNVFGRLALASAPTGTTSFSYDALGQVNGQVFTDSVGGVYVEQHTIHADGSPASLDLLLPDTGFADEHVDYAYDSAGRGKSVHYSSGPETVDLFEASTIDPLGRLRQAQFGLTSYAASYADIGRQLLNQVTASSLQGSRAISFGGYDPVGRERSRTETKNGAGTGTTTTFTYDPIGQLSHAMQTAGAATLFDQRYTYDPLGNLLGLSDTAASAGSTTTTLSYLDSDRDRICHIAYGADGNTACNVTYDEVGDVLSQQTSTGSRQYSYYIDGSVRTISDDKGSAAQFRYDAFGEVQELDLTSNVSLDTRHDRHYGELIAWRDVTTGVSVTSVLSRKIPGPHGFAATRRGPGGPWVFEFGEARGNRFFTDANGAFVQDVDYQPFGTATSTGAQPGSDLYSNEQWNFGDALTAFGISKLGARLYDPAIGRFLSRDPLLVPETSATTNPYAFAANDPVNGSDPSGLFQVTDIPDELHPHIVDTLAAGFSHDAYGFDDHFDDPPDVILTGVGSGPAGSSGGSRGTGGSKGDSGGTTTQYPGAPSWTLLYDRQSGDPSTFIPDYVQGWKDELDPKTQARRAIDAGMDAVDAAAPVVDAVAGGVADSIPILGTYRLCSAGNIAGCTISVVADVVVAMKLIRAGRYLVTLVMATEGSEDANIVYRSVNAAGKVQYVGITNDLARRSAEHLAARGFEIEKLLSGLSRSDARAVEQVLIELHGLESEGGTLLNKINGIAKTNPDYAKLLQRGQELLGRIGYK